MVPLLTPSIEGRRSQHLTPAPIGLWQSDHRTQRKVFSPMTTPNDQFSKLEVQSRSTENKVPRFQAESPDHGTRPPGFQAVEVRYQHLRRTPDGSRHRIHGTAYIRIPHIAPTGFRLTPRYCARVTQGLKVTQGSIPNRDSSKVAAPKLSTFEAFLFQHQHSGFQGSRVTYGSAYGSSRL